MYSFIRSIRAESALQRYELLVGVLLVRKEEQPSVDLPGRRIDTVGEVVAAAQDLDAMVPFGRRQGNMGSRRHQPVAVGAALAESS